jgi:hypothetical protein
MKFIYKAKNWNLRTDPKALELKDTANKELSLLLKKLEETYPEYKFYC